jgi:hypothetical protein
VGQEKLRCPKLSWYVKIITGHNNRYKDVVNKFGEGEFKTTITISEVITSYKQNV